MVMVELGVLKIMKAPTLSKALVIRINLVFIAFFLVIYASLLLQPSSSLYFQNAASLVRCSFRECHHKLGKGVKMEKILEPIKKNLTMLEVPSFIDGVGGGLMIGMVNFEGDQDLSQWRKHGETIPVHFDRVPEALKWQDLFPEWIDEEEESEVPKCPEFPMPNFDKYPNMDLLVAKLPCKCNDLVKQEGDWWYYEPDVEKLEQKIGLPVGSCKLALPLWGQQSLLKSGTNRDLILLLDDSISEPKRHALELAGWRLRFIKRIRNPRAQKHTYNEYNYSKFRLWQLTDYEKVIFIDADIIVLKNLDHLFHFPQLTATGNDVWLFNSGIMIIEPSNCTFKVLMDKRDEIISYNGGDQGYLNEVFVWWHRLPRRVNFLKNFWSNTTAETKMKNQLFAAEPPKLYSIHYLGLKPWLCYRDYDCNWNREDHHIFASDVAHRRWWKFHDAMDEKLQRFCGLTKKRKAQLDADRKKAKEIGLKDKHWKINIKDPRRKYLMK
ncbi:hypothetical protein GOBAR_AA08881 [Gossypium barbadense]|uniref:Hexosyltransferase n=1 Tax=Gossypium barbadense TaxID=3634 RepID=A0A2P5Y863_GOSBA|nr:hypothetical protein GOBAR_AA08881 [Gossypium barbadense]